ncbi:MAG: allantoicase [Vicinamibacterales bacterium]
MASDNNTPPFLILPDLAAARVGGRAIATNDDFFASKANLVKDDPAIFIPGKYTPRGKWMDGWESRRRRTPGHDWCVVALGMRGRIAGVNLDTHYFTGNFPSHASIESIDTTKAIKRKDYGVEGLPWTPLLAKVELGGDRDNFFAVDNVRPWTHLRLNIFPDGGVARLRVHGEVEVDWRRVAPRGRAVDLASVEHGGIVLEVSDMHYGAKGNMLMPGRARNMGDGWETRRRRGPGFDWAVIRLGHAGMVSKIEIDTNHFKGNYPDSASIEGRLARSEEWRVLLPQTRLKPHHRHFFSKQLQRVGAISHVRLNIFPDGGVSRLRVHGTLATS